MILRLTLCTLLGGVAAAAPPDHGSSEYIHDVWDARRGFPGGAIHSIAGTPDGYLWIGAERGLVRFDGMNFVLFDRNGTPALPQSPMVQLAVSSGGDLWIRTQEFNPIRLHGGKFETVPLSRYGVQQPATALVSLQDGDLLLPSLANNAFRFGKTGLSDVRLYIAQPNVLVADAASAPGGLWLGTRDSGLYYLPTGATAALFRGLRDRKINCLISPAGGDVWVGTDTGLVHLDQRGSVRGVAGGPLRGSPVLALKRDRMGSLWVGTDRGLFRVGERGDSAPDRVSSGAVTALYEDRENNVWIGGSQGLERIRASLFVTYDLPASADGGGRIFLGKDGSLWFTPSSGGLYSLGPEGVQRAQDEQAQDPNLTALLRKGVSAVRRSRDGSLWIGLVNSGVRHLSRAGLASYTVAEGLASNSVSSILEGSDGAVWFATANGLTRFSQGTWKTYRGSEGVPAGRLNCLFEDASHLLWIGTSAGLVFLRDGRVHAAALSQPILNEEVLGMAEDAAHWLWISATEHILRVRRDKLLSGNVNAGDIFDYGPQDGLQSTRGVRRDPSVSVDAGGRIWLVTEKGVSVVNPDRLDGASPPAVVGLNAVVADGKSLDRAGPIRMPSSTQRLIFSFSGLSLSAPERVRYRYRLDGFDNAWSNPTVVTEAAYSNLRPGNYQFRVIACNSQSLWNSAEATATFEILPMYWETGWFYDAVLLTLAAASYGIYRYRLVQITRRLNLRFEERLAERTLIGQELHDTLLQGVISASMQMHVALDQVPENSPLRRPLGGILELLGCLIDEGRNTVRGLRSASSTPKDLAQALCQIQGEVPAADGVEFRVVVEGPPRPLHPLLRDEAYRIGREALLNAIRHSGARAIEATLEYKPQSLRLHVRDDGRGIDPDVLRDGRDGHWGLPGMRERAERIGAQLHVFSSPGNGTEVELSIPGYLAYQPPVRPGRRGIRVFS
jgi:signal transduction histidine kinase/ligand-binding sensor domain-containing protein